MLAAPSQQRVVVSRWEMPSPRPRAKPLKWRNNQRSGYVRMPSRLALLIVCWLCIYIYIYMLAVISKIEVELTFEKWGQFLDILRIGNVQCVVPSSAMYTILQQVGRNATSNFGDVTFGKPWDAPIQVRCSCFGSTEHPYSSQQTGCSPNPLLLHAEQRHKPQKDHNHRP